MVCVLCEKNSVENWFGSFCPECRQIKNLGNVYGFDRVLEILKKCCIRDENQLERKIDNHKQVKTDTEATRSEEVTSKAAKPSTRARSQRPKSEE